MEKAGLKLIVRLSQDPDRPFWAGNPPQNAGDFADFVAAVASRYKGRIQAYQIWNEPNLAREWGKKRPDPAGLRADAQDRLTARSRAIDPNALVITAGMAPTGTDTNEAMPDVEVLRPDVPGDEGQQRRLLRHAGRPRGRLCCRARGQPGLKTAANKVPYGGERFFAFRHVEDIRKIMERYGDQDKRIAILEFGWTTDDRPDSPYYWHGAGAGIDEATKGKYLVRALRVGEGELEPVDRPDDGHLHAGRQLDQGRRAVLLVDHRPRLPRPVPPRRLRRAVHLHEQDRRTAVQVRSESAVA